MMTSSPNERPVIPLETEDDQQVVTQVWKDREITGHPDAVAEMVQQLEKGERREQLRRERWGGGGREGMARLCARFPSLQNADGASPFNVDRLLAWSFSGALTGGGGHALRFVLQVWSPRTNWRQVVEEVARSRKPTQEERPLWNVLQEILRGIRRAIQEDRPRLSGEELTSAAWERAAASFERFATFNVAEAWGCWDDEHRAAVTAWLEAPFYP